MSWWNPISWFGGGSGSSGSKKSSSSGSGGSGLTYSPIKGIGNQFNPPSFNPPSKSKSSSNRGSNNSSNNGSSSSGSNSNRGGGSSITQTNPIVFGGGGGSYRGSSGGGSSNNSNRGGGGGGSSQRPAPIYHPIKIRKLHLQTQKKVEKPAPIYPLNLGESLINKVESGFSSGERYIKKEYNSGYLNPLQPRKFLNDFALPNSKKVNTKYQPAHIGLTNPSSFNYPARAPAPTIKQAFVSAFKNEQSQGTPTGYQTLKQHSFSGNPLKELGLFLTNIFSPTRNLVPRKGDQIYVKKEGNIMKLTNQTVAQHYQKQIKNNPVLQTTEGKLVGLQVQKTSKRIANNIQTKLLGIYQKQAQKDYSNTQNLINRANNVTVENNLINQYKTREKKRNQEYSSQFQKQYKNQFNNQIRKDIASNKDIQTNQEFWKTYNSSLNPVVNLPKIFSSGTQIAGAIVSAPVSVGLGALGAVSGGHQILKGIKTGNIKSIGAGVLETALSGLMVRGGLSSLRSSAITKNIDSLLNPEVKYSQVHLFNTDKPNIYLLVKETPLKNANGNAFEKTFLYVEKKGNQGYSVVGGLSKVEGKVGVGSKTISFGNKNLIRGISTKGEIPVTFPVKNSGGLRFSNGNAKLSFSESESSPLSKSLIERNGKKGKFVIEEYGKGTRGLFSGKFKTKGGSLFIKGKPKLQKIGNLFERQPVSFSVNSPTTSLSGYVSEKGGYSNVAKSFPKRFRSFFEPRLPNFKTNEISFLKNEKYNNPSYYIEGSPKEGNFPKSSFNTKEIKKELKRFEEKKPTSKVTNKDIKILNKVIGKDYKVGQEMEGVTKGELLKELRGIGVNIPSNFKSLLKNPSKVPSVGLFASTSNSPQINTQGLFEVPKFHSPFQFQSSFNLKDFTPKTYQKSSIEIPRSIFGGGGSGGNRLIGREKLKPIRQIKVPKTIQKKDIFNIQSPKIIQRSPQLSYLGNLQFGNLFQRGLSLQMNRLEQRNRLSQRTRTIQKTKISPRQRSAEKSFSLIPANSLFNLTPPKINPSFAFGGKYLNGSFGRKTFKKPEKTRVTKTGYQASVGAVVLGLKTTKKKANQLIKHYEGFRLRPEIAPQVSLINRSEFNRMHPAFVKASPLIIDRLISEGNNEQQIMKMFTKYNRLILQNEQKDLLKRKYLTVSQKKKKLIDLKNQEKAFESFTKRVISQHKRRRNKKQITSYTKTKKIGSSKKVKRISFRKDVSAVSNFLINRRNSRRRGVFNYNSIFTNVT